MGTLDPNDPDYIAYPTTNEPGQSAGMSCWEEWDGGGGGVVSGDLFVRYRVRLSHSCQEHWDKIKGTFIADSGDSLGDFFLRNFLI